MGGPASSYRKVVVLTRQHMPLFNFNTLFYFLDALADDLYQAMIAYCELIIQPGNLLSLVSFAIFCLYFNEYKPSLT